MKRVIEEKIDQLDAKVNEKSEIWRSPLLLEFFEGITSLGSPVIVILMIGILGYVGEVSAATDIFTGLIIAGVVVQTVKRFTNRMRPDTHLDNVFSEKSFPSGHTTTAFMAATILTEYYDISLPFFSLAAAVAFSRIVLEDHYFSDVAAGTIIGLGIGTIVTLI